MSDPRFIEELKEYVGFTDAHARALADAHDQMAPGFPKIIERFYDAIQQTPEARAVFVGGPPQIERQKGFLKAWLEGVFSGVYDLEYQELRARIGRTHVRIRMDQRYMFSAMNLVREGLHLRLEETALEQKPLTHSAIDKICDIELAIMLQTYSEDYSARLRDNERLATLGQLAGFIGHELRNPLAVMETSLHLLKKRLPSDDEHAARHLQRLSEHLSASSGIIAALLDLARDKPLERASVALEPLVRAVVDGLSDTEQVELHIEIPADLPEARLDDQQMRHLIGNLVGNAIQALSELASDAPRRIEVRAQRSGEDLVISVDDTGRGVPESLRQRLFEPLVTGRAKGLGLGLALCRRIVEKHGGYIRALGSALGGARFEVVLPAAFGAAP